MFETMPVGMTQSLPTEQSLRSYHGSFVTAINSGNITMAQAMIHPNALGFFRGSQRVVELRSDYGAAEALPSIIQDLSQFDTITYDTTYRVLGNIGIVCATNNLQAKKWGAKDLFTRATYIYANVEGSWKLFSWHSSDIPLKK